MKIHEIILLSTIYDIYEHLSTYSKIICKGNADICIYTNLEISNQETNQIESG
jgi:hypothetical protein